MAIICREHRLHVAQDHIEILPDVAATSSFSSGQNSYDSFHGGSAMSARLGIRSGWLALMIGLLALGTLAAAELRQWSDATGKFKIKGKFVSLENGTVILEKEDGDEIEIELKKLSTADQKVANDLAKAKDDDPLRIPRRALIADPP